jgi:hypothetical protein
MVFCMVVAHISIKELSPLMSATPPINTLLTNLDVAGDHVVIGCGLIGLGVGVVLQDPAARAFCRSVLDAPRVREALDVAAAAACDRLSESLRRGGTPPGLTH